MKTYKKDDILLVKITAIEPYGAFVDVDNNYAGLIHISEINGKFIYDINKFFKIGNFVRAKVVDVDVDKKQIKFTMKGIEKTKKDKLKNSLEETELGFSILREKLPIWIKDKEIEIENSKI